MIHKTHEDDFVPCVECGDCLTCHPHERWECPTTPSKHDEFAGLTREMLITQIHQLRDLITMEREAAKQTEEALREAHDHAQEGLKSARKQEREMREQIALLKQHKCDNCGSFTVSVFSEPEPGR